MNRAAAEFASTLIGTPFMHQARLPQVGLDCAGVVICTGRSIGALLAEFNVDGYPAEPDPAYVLEWLESGLNPIQHPEIGDVLFMLVRGRLPHLALVSERGMIHASSHAGRVVENRIDDRWRRMIVSAWSWRELPVG